MAEIGYLSVIGALVLATLSAVSSALGAARGVPELIVCGRRSLFGMTALVTAAALILMRAFAVHDFSIRYVAETSSRTTPPLYLFTSLWGGQAGSLLFWSWLLAAFASLTLARQWKADAALAPYFTAVCAIVTGFFLILVAFYANPFARLAVIPADGQGLNPLLQHPGMAFHPPTLYLGLTGMTIPYAFAMAALASGRLDAGWAMASRRWTLVAWLFLSIGLTLGGRWAYDVLGWGGYWGWDPVENAALMPWLAATAFLHSVMVQERRGLFGVWNIALVILTFTLVIVGTFMTRAGLVSSVHAFARSEIGMPFVVFTGIVIVASLGMLWWRLPMLRSVERIESPISREAAFLGNNLLFMGALFAVFWGTVFPMIAEVVLDERVTVGPPYYQRLVMPVFWALVLLMAVGPLVGWRRSDSAALRRSLSRPAISALAITLLLFALGVRHWIAVVGFGTCAFAGIVTLLEILRGIRTRMRRGESAAVAGFRLFVLGRRRYGGYLVHLGIVLLAVGVVGNVYNLKVEATLNRGEAVDIGEFTLRFDGLETRSEPDLEAVVARFDVERDGVVIGSVSPSRQLFRLREDQPVTVPSILHRPLEDIYVLLGGFDEDGSRASIRAHVNPLVSWVWIGLVVLILGTLVAAWPDAAEERVLNTELQRLLGAARRTSAPSTTSHAKS